MAEHLIAAQYGNDAFKGMLDDPQNREPRIRHFFHQLALKLKKSVSVWPLEKFLFGSRVQRSNWGGRIHCNGDRRFCRYKHNRVNFF